MYLGLLWGSNAPVSVRLTTSVRNQQATVNENLGFA